MATTLTGKILYANGLSAPGVQVRVFDKDAPGKGDDDLTIEPGLTGADGSFTVRYDPGRYMDFARLPVLGLQVPDLLDILSPYLELRYTLAGQERVCARPLVPFQNRYSLPESAPLDFLPSRHGFAFHNNFPPISLPFTLPGFPNPAKITGGYGLCGGMSAAASDYYLAGCPVPPVAEVPRARTRLYRYLFRRAMDSFQMGASVLRFAQWMALDQDGPNGTARLTWLEFEKLLPALDAQQLVPIGLLISEGRDLRTIFNQVWQNHQVLAYGYFKNEDASVDIRVYDPNVPGGDDVTIRVTREHIGDTPDGPLYGARCQPAGLRIHPMRIRGFFLMPYEPADPPIIRK